MDPTDQQGPSHKKAKYPSDSDSDSSDDAFMEDPQAGPSTPRKVDIDGAVDLMRLVFREGMPFQDNGSGRGLLERMFVDLPCFMVNELYQVPAVSDPDAPRRMWTVTPTIDNDVAHAFAKETRKGIGNEIQGDFYGIYADMIRSYMVLFARYLNGKGEVVERLLGVVPEPDARGLRVAVDGMLSEAGLSWSNVRGQGHGLFGYGDEIFTELRASIADENASAHCVHPYACQLHSSLVSSSHDPFEVHQLLQTVDVLSNLIRDCPRFTEKVCELIRERGMSLDGDLRKPGGETQWGSYYEALVKFAAYFDPICDALYFVEKSVDNNHQSYLAYKVLEELTYDLAFASLLMKDVLGATSELSLALDSKDPDAENCVALVQQAKKQLQVMRDEGWASFLNKVGMFCTENDIPMPCMGDQFEHWSRSRDQSATMTNLEHYRTEFFERIISVHLNQLDKRFSEQSSALFLLSSCLNPRNSFQAFDKEKLLEYARFYPSEFPDSNIAALDLQLQPFVADARSDARFRDMSALSDLSVKMVATGKNTEYPLVYLLLKLALILPGTPATAKTASSALKFMDRTMANEPCNQWTSDCLLLFLERDIFESVTNDAVIAALEAKLQGP